MDCCCHIFRCVELLTQSYSSTSLLLNFPFIFFCAKPQSQFFPSVGHKQFSGLDANVHREKRPSTTSQHLWLRRGLLPAKPFAAQKRVDVVTCSRRTNGGIHRRRYKVKAENGIYCVVPPNEDELRWPLELCWTAKSKKNVIFLSFKAATEYTE